jgi:hypothetical protein
MLPLVLPLRMVVFQSMFLLTAIALESIVLIQRLQITPRKGVEYATTINFLAAATGWLLFVSFQSVLPATVRLPLIAFVLLDQWSDDLLIWIILAAITTFFLSFLMKWMGFNLLKWFLGDRQPGVTTPGKESLNLKTALKHRLEREQQVLDPSAKTILLANAVSYTAMVAVLAIRFAWNL